MSLPESIRQLQLSDPNSEDYQRCAEYLFCTFKEVVYGLCLGLMKNKQDAEDMFQNTWATVFKEIGQVREPEAFKGWVCKIAYYCCIERLRRRSRRNQLTQHFPLSMNPHAIQSTSDISHTLEPYTDYRRHGFLSEFDDGLLLTEITENAKLTPLEGSVWALVRTNGASVREAGKKLSVPYWRAKNAYDSAKRKLKKLVEALNERS